MDLVVSIIIPSRAGPYLQKTIDDLISNAAGEIEIIVVLDGIRPAVKLKTSKNVTVLHHGSQYDNLGLRASVNLGSSHARGEYIMKTDEHCAFDKGYDLKLTADCQDNWLVTPRRHELDEQAWRIRKKVRCVYNMYFKYPGLSYARWSGWNHNRQDLLIDDCMGMEGSCYFMRRKHWDWLGGLDDKLYGKFHYESQEICLKTWLGGGRVVTNKKTWYAHWHRRAKDYKFSPQQYSELYESKNSIPGRMNEYWIYNYWPQRVHDFEWLIEKFWPVPNWPENWKQELYEGKAGQ